MNRYLQELLKPFVGDLYKTTIQTNLKYVFLYQLLLQTASTLSPFVNLIFKKVQGYDRRMPSLESAF